MPHLGHLMKSLQKDECVRFFLLFCSKTKEKAQCVLKEGEKKNVVFAASWKKATQKKVIFFFPL